MMQVLCISKGVCMVGGLYGPKLKLAKMKMTGSFFISLFIIQGVSKYSGLGFWMDLD